MAHKISALRPGRFAFAYILLPVTAGALSGALVFLFKAASNRITAASHFLYTLAESSWYALALFFAAVILLSFFSSVILDKVPDSKGGGIPSAVAVLRGLTPINWLKSMVFVFLSSLVTFLAGVPLGNEGPSVQMGTAVGRMTVRLFGKRHAALNRYIMTGGACAGFAVATGAPLAGIFFALEEAHRRFTPTIMITATVSVLSGVTVSGLLSRLTGISPVLLSFPVTAAIPPEKAWIGAVAGLFAGFAAICIFYLFRGVRKLWEMLKAVPRFPKLAVIFLLTAVAGLLIPEATGTGHSLLAELFEGGVAWYLLPVFLAVRALLAAAANNSGVTGGLFVPQIVFGALCGAILSSALSATGLSDVSYTGVIILISVSAFLAAALKTPVTAIVFTAELSGGLSNIGVTLLAVLMSYMLIELLKLPALNDIVLEAKVAKERTGKQKTAAEAVLTVMPEAYVIGREPRDILWPSTCLVLKVKRSDGSGFGHHLSSGDTIRLRFESYDIDATSAELNALLGEQPLVLLPLSE